MKKDGNFMRFDFRVKFYPEDIDEILQVKTLKLFFQQVSEIRVNGGDYSIEKNLYFNPKLQTHKSIQMESCTRHHDKQCKYQTVTLPI